MTNFDQAMNSIAKGYLKGAMKGQPNDQHSEMLRAALDDAVRAGFQAGFVLARVDKSIPVPKTAVYKNENQT